MATVHEAARRALLHHRHELQGSLVYVDAGAAEVLACAFGADALTGAHPAGGHLSLPLLAGSILVRCAVLLAPAAASPLPLAS